MSTSVESTNLRLHSHLSEVLTSRAVFIALMIFPLIGLALIASKGAWSSTIEILLVSMPLTFLFFRFEMIVRLRRLKLSSIFYDDFLQVDGITVRTEDIISIEEVCLNPGGMATKYNLLVLCYRTDLGTSQALCMAREGWFMKDWLSGQNRSIRLLLGRCPELEHLILPIRVVKHANEIVTPFLVK